MNKKATTIAVHILCWVLYLFLPIVFSPSFGVQNKQFPHILGYPLHFFLINIFLVPLFYLNTYLLVPKLYFENKKILYFASILVLLLLFLSIPELFMPPLEIRHVRAIPQNAMLTPAGIKDSLRIHFPGKPIEGMPMQGPGRILFAGPRIIPRIVSFCLVWLLGLLLRITERWQQAEKKSKENELEKVQAELSYLKLQINPHFLFNTLNNIYSLASIQSNKTPEAVLKLSDIMRYVTQDAQADWVTVRQEIQYLRSYIELQQMRSNDKLQLTFEANDDVSSQKIAPLLLISFVENAFKYGLSSHENSTIIIKVREENKVLHLFVQNNIFKKEATGATNGNIGISNTKRRLELLYPGKHTLTIQQSGAVFSIYLKIDLA